MKSFKHFGGGSNTDVLTASDYINCRVLAASTAETETPPSDAAYAVFSSNADFRVCWNGSAATVPGADVTNGNGSELNPTERYIVGIATFSIIAESACTVNIAYFSE